MSRVVVTGGAGFIGSHIVDALIDAGHQVTVLSNHVRPHRDDVAFEDVNILDMASLLTGTRGAEYIFHLAAVADVNRAYKLPVYTTADNILGTTHVLEAARQNGARRVFLASTIWVYNGSSSEEPLDESSVFHMNGGGHIYTTSKMAAEMLCHNYADLYKVPFTVMRLGIPFGPRMREELLIPAFVKKALFGEPLTISGDGSQFRNFIYVKDIAAAHVRAMDDVAANQTYNLEGPRKVTVLEVAQGVRAAIGDHVKIEFVPARPGDFGGKTISAEKASRELGWQPKMEFEEGLKITIDWFRKKWGK